MDFGEKIKQLRLSRDMTLEQVGNIVGVGKSTVRKWENGDIKNMGRDKIELLAQALGVTPGYLMGWEETGVILHDIDEKLTKPFKSQSWAQIQKAFGKMSESDIAKALNVLSAVYPQYFDDDDK
jgi:transcriptional regulator with XRE-family HTH domain